MVPALPKNVMRWRRPHFLRFTLLIIHNDIGTIHTEFGLVVLVFLRKEKQIRIHYSLRLRAEGH